MSNLIICADDFGLTKNINHSIIELASENKIQATSIMFSNIFRNDINIIKDSNIHLGLHYYMTTLPIKNIIIKHPVMIYKYHKMIADTFIYQLNSLEDILGRKVDYIDSHQYILSFPYVFDILMDKYSHILEDRIIKLATSPIKDSFKIKLLSKLTKKIQNKYSLNYINGILGLSNFDETVKQVYERYNNSKKIIENLNGVYHYSTHPCKDPSDIINLDSLIDFRKIDYLFLKGLT